MNRNFTDQVCQQLDNSVEQLDPALVDQLAQARRTALAQQIPAAQNSNRRLMRSTYVWPAMAAAVLLMVIFPNVSMRPTAIPQALSAASYYEVDPELLETMDLLWVVDDFAESEMNAL